jgi:hypothetical protein
MKSSFLKELDMAQAKARAVKERGKGVAAVEFGGEAYKVKAGGGFNFRWQFGNDDFLILVAPPGTDFPITIRYLSAGLWEHGVDALRARALESLKDFCKPARADHQRISRADFCFDFHSPQFAKEFVPDLLNAVVAPSGCKSNMEGKYALWGRRGKVQTLTIGKITSLQNQIYNKTDEITEQSGKTWLYDLWERELGERVTDDVFRFEMRFSSDFLKERNIRTTAQMMAVQAELITEACYSRRLCVPTDDGHQQRWPLHPLMSEVMRRAGCGRMVPLGRKVTGRRKKFLETMDAALRGYIRSRLIAEHGDYSEERAYALFRELIPGVKNEPSHGRKCEEAQCRYSDLEDAR